MENDHGNCPCGHDENAHECHYCNRDEDHDHFDGDDDDDASNVPVSKVASAPMFNLSCKPFLDEERTNKKPV